MPLLLLLTELFKYAVPVCASHNIFFKVKYLITYTTFNIDYWLHYKNKQISGLQSAAFLSMCACPLI